jgi:hypothetical protein
MATGTDGTDYQVLIRGDGTYSVEVKPLGRIANVVEGFRTRAEAEQWIYDRMTALASDLPLHAGPRSSTPGVEPEQEA